MEIYILGINFFFPTFNMIIGSSLGSVLLNLILIWLSILNIGKSKNKKISKKKMSIVIFYIFMITFSFLLNINTNNIRDLFEYSRPLLMLLSLVLGYNYYSPRKKIEDELTIIFDIFILINVLKFIWPQLIFFRFYQRDYLAERIRLSGTFISPYDYAYFLILPFIYYFDLYLKNKNLKTFLKTIFFFVSILLTQSRSQFITALIGIFLFFIIKIFFFRENIKILVKIFLIFNSTVFFVLINYKEKLLIKLDYLILGIQNILKNGFMSDPSTRIRFQQIIDGFNMFLQSNLLLGRGPSKDIGLQIENFYMLYLYRYGINGIIYTTIICLICFCLSIRILRNSKESFDKAYSIWLLVLPIALLPNNTIDQIRVCYFFFFLLGYFLKKEKELNLNQKKIITNQHNIK